MKFDFNIDVDNIEKDNLLSKNAMNTLSQKDSFLLHDQFIDLDLPSGTLWCKYNLGVDLGRLHKAKYWSGKYYAWGETFPKQYYDQKKYKYGHTFNNYLKYCDDKKYGKVDNLSILELEDDAAYVNDPFEKIGIDVCIPNEQQFRELLANTKHYWIRDYQDIQGLDGCQLDGKNGNSIFLPAGGHWNKEKRTGCRKEGKYWLNEVSDYDCRQAKIMHFEKAEVSLFHECNFYQNGNTSRYMGLPIRPVVMKK